MSDTKVSNLNDGYVNDAYTRDAHCGKIEPLDDTYTKESYQLNEVKQKSDTTLRLEQDDRMKKDLGTLNKEENDDEEELDGQSLKDESLLGIYVIKGRELVLIVLKKPIVKWILAIAALIGFVVYFSLAMARKNPFKLPKNLSSAQILKDHVFAYNQSLALFCLTLIVILFILYDKFLIKSLQKMDMVKFSQSQIWHKQPFKLLLKIYSYSWFKIVLVICACALYLIFQLEDASSLIALLGIAVIVSIATLMSAHPSKIQWKTLVSGILIQFILGVFVLRTEFGYLLFKFLGDQVSTFLEYTDYGSRLVFGDSFTDHFFAFKAMPVIIFFSAIVNLLYYLGFVQYAVTKLAWVVNSLMGTSPTESISATANIFLGQTEAPLLIKPFLPKMTVSELFAIMTGGFATVAGSVLAAYIGFGVPPSQLITASIMAAPAGLALAKVIHPETKKSRATWDSIKNFEKGTASNVFEAFSQGAAAVVGVVGAIIANLIAFTAIFQFLDTSVTWFFDIVGLENFGLASILQYVFWPLAYVMGTAAEDCLSVGKLIGIKVLVNELIAYRSLGQTISFLGDLKKNETIFNLYRNGTLPVPSNITMIWNDKSISITTFALCGFSNVASMGIQIGGLSALAPSRSKIFARYALKAMIAGNLASFMNACVSGLLFEKL